MVSEETFEEGFDGVFKSLEPEGFAKFNEFLYDADSVAPFVVLRMGGDEGNDSFLGVRDADNLDDIFETFDEGDSNRNGIVFQK